MIFSIAIMRYNMLNTFLKKLPSSIVFKKGLRNERNLLFNACALFAIAAKSTCGEAAIGGVCGGWVNETPQFAQNTAPSAFCAPQEGQKLISCVLVVTR